MPRDLMANPVRQYACLADYILSTLREGGREPPEPQEGQIVYFVGGDDGPVKIGTTREPEVRLQRMQSGSPVPLKILAAVPGGSLLERGYHICLNEHRLHGEWFERETKIEAEIRYWRAKCRRLPCVSA